MDFCFLGTSGAVLTEGETTTSLLFRSEIFNVMIDCPGNAVSVLQQIGCSPLDLDGVILTHAHPDHICGLPLFIQNLLLLDRKKKLFLIANSYTMNKVKSLLQLFNLQNNLPFEVIYLSQESGFAKSFGRMAVELVPVSHSLPTVGVLIRNDDYKLFYTADTGPIPDIIKALAPLNTLIHEASGLVEDERTINSFGHSSGRQAAQVASQIDVEKLFLCHFDHRIDDVIAKTVREAEVNAKQQIIVPERLKFYSCNN